MPAHSLSLARVCVLCSVASASSGFFLFACPLQVSVKRFDDENDEEGEHIEIARVETMHDSRVYKVEPEVSNRA